MHQLDSVLTDYCPDFKMYGEWWGGPVGKQFTYKGGRKSGTALTIIPPTIHFDFENQFLIIQQSYYMHQRGEAMRIQGSFHSMILMKPSSTSGLKRRRYLCY